MPMHPKKFETGRSTRRKQILTNKNQNIEHNRYKIAIGGTF